MIFVIAGDYKQYKVFLRQNPELKDNVDVRPMLRPDDLRGYHDIKVVFTGTWGDRRLGDAWEFLMLAGWEDVTHKYVTT